MLVFLQPRLRTRERSTVLPMLMLMLFTLSVAQSAKLWSYEIEHFPSARKLQPRTSDPRMIPNSAFGMHFLRMYFGNPAQMRTLGVSPSSTFTVLPCDDCVDCGDRGSNIYNSSGSSGFSLISCDKCSMGASCFNDRCAVGKSTSDLSSWSGYEVSDFAFHGGGRDPFSIVGSDSAKMFGFPLRFVCQTRTRGFFNDIVDGVIGLSPAPTSFLGQMHAAGKLEHPRFSLCFNAIEYSDGGKATGVVTFGGFERAFLETEMVYAKQLVSDVYKVNIKEIHLRVGGGRSVQAFNNHVTVSVKPPTDMDTTAVVDTSAPFLTFDKRFEEPFRAAWRGATGLEFTEARIDLTAQQLATMPTLLIELEGDKNSPRELDPLTVSGLTTDYNVLVAVPAIHYMERLVTDVRPYRARIRFEGEQGSLLGATFVQGHTVSYEPDLFRIGFAESAHCQATGKKGGARTATGRSNMNEQHAEIGVPASVRISGRSSTTSSAPAQAAAATDDMFVAGAGSSKPGSAADDDSSGRGGGCYTATCRSFMAVGYVFVGTALAVAYRLSRPKVRVVGAGNERSEDKRVIHHQDDLHSTYRRKSTWNDADGPLLV